MSIASLEDTGCVFLIHAEQEAHDDEETTEDCFQGRALTEDQIRAHLEHAGLQRESRRARTTLKTVVSERPT